MSLAEDLLNRKEKPAYVKFIREPREDTLASKQQGMYVAKDVDIACITPAYSRDVMKFEVSAWFEQMVNDVRNERMPQEWAEKYRAQYEAWKKGEELPLDGVPIKGWAVASPAQQETLLRMNVLTVEDLAKINDEGIRRIGMGGWDLKNKAVAWLQSVKDNGQVVQQVASLKQENALLKGTVDTLQSQIAELTALVKAQRSLPAEKGITEVVEPPPSVVPVSGRAELEGAYRAKFGRNPHPSSSDETLRARLSE